MVWFKFFLCKKVGGKISKMFLSDKSLENLKKKFYKKERDIHLVFLGN